MSSFDTTSILIKNSIFVMFKSIKVNSYTAVLNIGNLV